MKLKKIAKRILPRKFSKHYIRPLFVKEKKQYNPSDFFNSMYSSTKNDEFSDGVTINPVYNPLFAKFHYNAVENSIIKVLVDINYQPPKPLHVLDIGSGAGHWIDFYKKLLKPDTITSIDISNVVVDNLTQKYCQDDSIKIIKGDISENDSILNNKFDIINAIGVIFHIVDDQHWQQAIKNLARHLNHQGVILIGGHFGFITQDVQFHHKDEFKNHDTKTTSKDKPLYVNKRIRSLRYWKKCAKMAELKIVRLQKTQNFKNIQTPENNILCLSLDKSLYE